MKRVVAGFALVAACSGTGSPATTVDLRVGVAGDYAASADRALDGTRFSALPASAVADLIVALCAGEGSVLVDLAAAVAGVAAPPGDAGDDDILYEVLVTGLATVCPERVAADLTAAYLGAVHATVASGGGVAIDDTLAVGIGLAACEALDAGTPEDALVTVAAGGFGIEATPAEILAGSLDAAQGITAGAILASATAYLCPEHRERVAGFVAELSRES